MASVWGIGSLDVVSLLFSVSSLYPSSFPLLPWYYYLSVLIRGGFFFASGETIPGVGEEFCFLDSLLCLLFIFHYTDSFHSSYHNAICDSLFSSSVYPWIRIL